MLQQQGQKLEPEGAQAAKVLHPLLRVACSPSPALRRLLAEVHGLPFLRCRIVFACHPRL